MSVQPPPLSLIRWLSPVHFEFIRRVVAGAEPFPEAVATSWFRLPWKNLSVGGDPRSQHLLGLGVDIVPAPPNRLPLARSLRAQGLVAIVEPTHIHVQAFQAGTIPEALFG
jgi:hypothetical protein